MRDLESSALGVAIALLVVAGLDLQEVQAQSGSPSLSEFFRDLLLGGITLPRPTNADLSHEGHFRSGRFQRAEQLGRGHRHELQ